MNEGRRSNPIQWLLIGGALLFLVVLFFPRPSGATDLEITQVLEMAAAGQVATIEVRGEKLNVITTDGQTFSSRKEGSVSVLELLDRRGIETGAEGIQINVKGEGLSFSGLFLSALPLIIFVGLMLFMLRRARGGIGQMMSIGKSRAKLVVDPPSVTFDDVAGADEAKQELAEIVEFLRTPEKFAKLGAKIPRGVLLAGPRAPARPLSPGRWPERRRSPFSPSAVANSWRCSVGSGPAGCGTSSTRPRRGNPPSSSSTRSMRWGDTGALA